MGSAPSAGWKVKSDVAEWLVEQILQSVNESADVLQEVKRQKQLSPASHKKGMKKVKGQKANTKLKKASRPGPRKKKVLKTDELKKAGRR